MESWLLLVEISLKVIHNKMNKEIKKRNQKKKVMTGINRQFKLSLDLMTQVAMGATLAPCWTISICNLMQKTMRS
jgi:molybdenum cofactor biosynthesis enzyme MoaA